MADTGPEGSLARTYQGKPAYLALAGASIELVRPVVRVGQTATLPSLEEPLMSLHMALLADRPWTA